MKRKYSNKKYAKLTLQMHTALDQRLLRLSLILFWLLAVIILVCVHGEERDDPYVYLNIPYIIYANVLYIFCKNEINIFIFSDD